MGPHVTGQAGMTCTWKGQHATAAPGTFPVLFSHSIPSDPAMLQQPATVTCYSVGNIAVRLPSLAFGFLASILIRPPASWQAQAPLAFVCRAIAAHGRCGNDLSSELVHHAAVKSAQLLPMVSADLIWVASRCELIIAGSWCCGASGFAGP